MPVPMPAPQVPLGLSHDNTPPTQPLPQLNPAAVATLRNRSANDNTLERPLRSAVTLRELRPNRGWLVWLLFWLVVLSLLGGAYLTWGPKDAGQPSGPRSEHRSAPNTDQIV